MAEFYQKWADGGHHIYHLMTNDRARECIDYFKLHGSTHDLLPSHFVFRMTNLDLDIFAELVDMFKNSTTLTSLRIHGFDLERLRKLAELVNGNLYIRKLYLYFDDRICDQSVEIIANIIRTNSTLDCLYFGSNWIMSDNAAEYLIRALKDNSSLTVVGFAVYRSPRVKDFFVDILKDNSTLEDFRFLLPMSAPLEPRIKELLIRNRHNKRMRETGLLWELIESGVLDGGVEGSMMG